MRGRAGNAAGTADGTQQQKGGRQRRGAGQGVAQGQGHTLRGTQGTAPLTKVGGARVGVAAAVAPAAMAPAAVAAAALLLVAAMARAAIAIGGCGGGWRRWRRWRRRRGRCCRGRAREVELGAEPVAISVPIELKACTGLQIWQRTDPDFRGTRGGSIVHCAESCRPSGKQHGGAAIQHPPTVPTGPARVHAAVHAGVALARRVAA